MTDFFLDFHGRYHLSPDRSIYETFNRPKEEKTRRIETCCDISSITFNFTKLRFRKKRSNYCWCQSKRRTTQNWFAHLRPCQSKLSNYSQIHWGCDVFWFSSSPCGGSTNGQMIQYNVATPIYES